MMFYKASKTVTSNYRDAVGVYLTNWVHDDGVFLKVVTRRSVRCDKRTMSNANA